ncbi:hypothetical protein CHS0354_018934 [Potamilus streckersoni]|uniref:Uncharacterized protein n=1 Tax=Potamilus streckersoni TaxID=2493646 RepID=A0AAE0RMV6_9BIVA|nr:hypothetical protein CHS0354_018934 [Potamilus streckersoni]
MNDSLMSKVDILSGNLVASYKKMESKPGSTTSKPPTEVQHCSEMGERQCEDGSCILRVDLCPEEELMNQNTILIMIVVGLAVIIFLIILYCFQQRKRQAGRMISVLSEEGDAEDGEHASLYAPPPTYHEVITTDLYPPTPQQQPKRNRMSSTEEPRTPPPTYDIALHLLAVSDDSILNKIKKPCPSKLIRRSLSLNQINSDQTQTPQTTHTPNKRACEYNKKNCSWKFNFSRQFSLNLPRKSERGLKETDKIAPENLPSHNLNWNMNANFV